jgi:hypothetical protein
MSAPRVRVGRVGRIVSGVLVPGLLGGLAAGLMTGMASCATTGDDATSRPDRAATLLDSQRTDVRAAARTMLKGAEQRLAGTATRGTGGWRGCESAAVEEYRNFRYLAQGRVEVGPGAPERSLTALREVLEDAGFTAGEVGPGPGGGGSTSIVGTQRDLMAVFSSTGGAAVGPVIGLDVYGPCIDVPEDERDAWLRRDEPTPALLQR